MESVELDPQEIIRALAAQLTDMHVQLAARDAYIAALLRKLEPAQDAE